jgi:dihydroanticapsin dehydrogenase
VLADIRDKLGENITTEIRDQGGRACYVHTDVTRSDDAKNLADSALSAFGAIHVLFNNAGTAIGGKVDVLSEEDWDKTFNVNVKSMFLCSKFVIPIMRKAGRGVIINQASESGLIGFPMHPAYCASKAAVINLTRSMAIGHAHENIRVNCICPGTIPTPLYHEFMSTLPDKDEVIEMIKKSHPLGLGTEEDIAFAALFLASDESKYMTGAPLIIDGGFTAI